MQPKSKALIGQLGDVDLRLLRVFKAVADCGGMAAAELELNIAISTISKHVKDLEQRLGLVLCRRGRGGFALTPEGRQLVGNSGNAGPTVTAGGLVFVGATNDKRFRAFDSATGKQLWEATLTNNGNANPLTYRGRSGKQYVAINAGGAIVAFALR